MRYGIVLFCLLLGIVVYGQEKLYFVSPYGNDTNEGAADSPLKTLNAARDRIRELKKQDLLIVPVTVYLREGNYDLTEALVLDHKDSGNENLTITFAAYGKEVPVLTCEGSILKLEGGLQNSDILQNITIRGLTFIHNGKDTGAAVSFNNTRNCSFSENTIIKPPATGIEVSGEGNQILGNRISDAGVCGILCSTTGEKPNLIAFNHIYTGDIKNDNSAGICVNSGGINITNNLIHNIPYAGIIAENRNVTAIMPLLIEKNEINHIGDKKFDCFGIKLENLSDIVIRNNIISDIDSFYDKFASAIFLSGASSNIIVENNIIYRNNECLTVSGSGSNITIRNNYFIESRNDIIRFNGSDYSDIKLTCNIFYFTSSDANVYFFNGEASLPETSEKNLFWNPRGCMDMRPVIKGITDGDYFEEWQILGFDISSIVADPEFKDQWADDYSLSSGSPALRLGIEPVESSSAGLVFP